jgi:hypothetical protein
MSGSTAALVAREDLARTRCSRPSGAPTSRSWPLLRWPMSTALSHSQYDTELAPRREGAGSKATRFTRTVLPSANWSRRLRAGHPVLFAGPGSRNVPSPGGYVNPLLGPFAAELGSDAAMLQYEPIPRGRRHAFEPTATFEDAVVASEVGARLAPPRASVLRAARDVAEDLFARVDHPIDARLHNDRVANLRHPGAPRRDPRRVLPATPRSGRSAAADPAGRRLRRSVHARVGRARTRHRRRRAAARMARRRARRVQLRCRGRGTHDFGRPCPTAC